MHCTYVCMYRSGQPCPCSEQGLATLTHTQKRQQASKHAHTNTPVCGELLRLHVIYELRGCGYHVCVSAVTQHSHTQHTHTHAHAHTPVGDDLLLLHVINELRGCGHHIDTQHSHTQHTQIHKPVCNDSLLLHVINELRGCGHHAVGIHSRWQLWQQLLQCMSSYFAILRRHTDDERVKLVFQKRTKVDRITVE